MQINRSFYVIILQTLWQWHFWLFFEFKHANKSMSLCGKICITPHKCLRKEKKRRDFDSRCSIVAAAAMSWRCCVLPNIVRDLPFLSHACGIRPSTTHWVASQSEHTTLFRMMTLLKSTCFRKAGQRGATIMYSMCKMCFLNLKLHKQIVLHQIHQIMLFLASSYDITGC